MEECILTIAEVSKKYDITADTLRYYERIGLIPAVPRKPNGIRDYDQASCQWVELMKCMRKAGVQIEALIEYVALFRQGDETDGCPGKRFSLNRENVWYRKCRICRKHWNAWIIK